MSADQDFLSRLPVCAACGCSAGFHTVESRKFEATEDLDGALNGALLTLAMGKCTQACGCECYQPNKKDYMMRRVPE